MSILTSDCDCAVECVDEKILGTTAERFMYSKEFSKDALTRFIVKPSSQVEIV